MSSRIVSVGSLASFLKDLVESDEVLQDIWVEGEVSSFTVPGSGHAYFTIKDAKSAIDGVMWKATRARQSFSPRVGDKITVHGAVTIYEKNTRLQVRADVFYPAGAGLMQLQLEQLRQRLEAEGLFDPSRKRPLPLMPTRIGVVTSPTGAVWHDIQRVLGRRYPLAELVLAPAVVQGEAAPASVIRALAQLQAEQVDVIIVARGGGSPEDLWAFNDERLVRAVFGSAIPVISAIGHETDISLIDEVADVRAPTPSAAAEIVAPDLSEITQYIDEMAQRLSTVSLARVERRKMALDTVSHRLQRVSPLARLTQMERDLETEQRQLETAIAHQIERRNNDVRAIRAVLRALDPASLMQRGYAWVSRDVDGEAVRSVSEASSGQRIRIDWADGFATGSLDTATAHSALTSEGKS